MKKRLLSALLALCMVLTLLPPGTALAVTVASGTCGDNLTWVLTEDGTLTISGTGTMNNFSHSLDAPWYASYSDQIQAVIIETGVANIGSSAFEACRNLTRVVISDSVTSIGNSAFQFCSNLIDIDIPDGVTRIGQDAFSGCSNLTSITIPDSVTSLGGYAFWYCSNLNNIELSSNLTDIGSYTFYRCSSLTNITIPDSVTYIGSYAFNSCSGLISVNIPEGVLSISDGAFSGCSSLVSITIPDSVISIGSRAFESCGSLIDIAIPDGVSSIANEAFAGCSSLISIALPDGVTSIGYGTFISCSSLTDIVIPNNVTTIGYEAFRNCRNLTSVTIPVSVTSIGNSAFEECGGLTDVYYAGSESQWRQIEVWSFNDPLLNATVHYNSTGPDGGDNPPSGDDDITLQMESTTVAVDGELYISAYIPHDGTLQSSDITWSSNDNGIATVTPGGVVMGNDTASVTATIKGVSEGSVTITISLADGRSASIEVKINSSAGPSTGDISIQSSAYSIYTGEETLIEVRIPNGSGLTASDISWTSNDENIIEIVSTSNGALGSTMYAYATVHAVGKTLGTASIRITLSNGKTAVCTVTGAGDKPKQSTPSYQAPEASETKEGLDLLQYRAAEWEEKYNDYLDQVVKALKKYTETAEGKRNAAIATKATEMQQNDAKSNSKYLTFPANFPSSWKSYAYTALATYLYDCTCSKMDFGGSLSTINMVNTVLNAMSSTAMEYEFGNIVMNVSAFQFSGTKVGSITCYSKSSKGTTYTVVVSSTQSECMEAIKDFAGQLEELGEAAANNVYAAVFTDIVGKSPSAFTKKWLTDKLGKYVNQFDEAGVGDLINDLLNCKEYFDFVQKITSGDISSAEKLLTSVASLNFDSTTLADKAASKAMKALNNAGSALEESLSAYIKGELKESGWQKFWRTTFGCPVSISVYNSSGEQIGYVGEDDIWYTSAISIRESGEAKIIDSYTDDELSFSIVGTDHGTVSCSVEAYDLGIAVGRTNFYDIPVDSETELTLSLTKSSVDSNPMDAVAMTTSTGESIQADEYISADQKGGILISVAVVTDVETTGGTVLGAGTYIRGDAVVLTASPEVGYHFVGWYQGEALLSTSKVYEFSAKENLELTAAFNLDLIGVGEFEPEQLMFTDVSEDDWFYDAVAYVTQNGLMQGVGGGKFNSSGTTTRSMIVTTLYRLEGEPTVSQSTFTDVAAGQWYTDAVAWAAANKIVEGYGNNTFGPNDEITREQMATILYRYATYKGYDVSGLADLSDYTDAGTISSWALTAMRWANSEGLITGRTTTTLVPNGTASRAEAATILARFCRDVADME